MSMVSSASSSVVTFANLNDESEEEYLELVTLQILSIYFLWKLQYPQTLHREVRVIYSRLVWEDYWQQYLRDPKFE